MWRRSSPVQLIGLPLAGTVQQVVGGRLDALPGFGVRSAGSGGGVRGPALVGALAATAGLQNVDVQSTVDLTRCLSPVGPGTHARNSSSAALGTRS
jgi:hypothetical protein